MAKRPRRSLLRRLLILFLVVVVAIPVALVGLYRFVPPPVTPLMLLRLPKGNGLDYRWRPLSRLSPALVQAATEIVAAKSDDGNFEPGMTEEAHVHEWPFLVEVSRRPG